MAATIPGADVPDSAAPNGEHGAQPPRVFLHMPVDVRSVSLGVLAVLASVYTLRWARAVFIPVLLGLLLSYALTPIVSYLKRWHVPRALGAAVLLIGLLSGAGSMLNALSDDATALIESLPEAAQKLRLALRTSGQDPPRTIDNVQKAAAELERAAAEGPVPAAPSPPGVTRVEIAKPRFNVKDYLWTGTIGLAALAGQTAVVILIAFFLLASGDTFRRKMVRLAGPKLSTKRVTLETLNDIAAQMQRFVLVQVFTSAIVGVATWLAFAWIGLEHAAVWGVVAGVTNLIPYLGGVFMGASSALVGFMQFGTLEMALLVGGAAAAIHGVVGNLLTPWLTSRANRMSPVTVFIGVLAWGWLWGVWGLLLGVPILTAVKAVCDRVENLNPIGELLGS